jgi:hypothetical protein
METIGVDSSSLEPRSRTVGLVAALAVGSAAVAGAFGAGYVVARAGEEPTSAAVPLIAAGAATHTWGEALTESLVLKQRTGLGGKVTDIRKRRIE